jgi:putative DNA methylase
MKPMGKSSAALRKAREHAQASLGLFPVASSVLLTQPGRERRAIEDEDFPFEALSDIAELESWRKEVSRPLSHIHKWWAQRLGTVFRAILLATFAPAGSDPLKLFYAPTRLEGTVVFDPFMGSGTTLVEALKTGARAIGRDINPVAWFLVQNALALHDRKAVIREFKAIERDIAPLLRPYYVTELDGGRTADVLYYFWVKTLACPACAETVELRNSYVFAQHAYAHQNPTAQAVCPHCGEINETRYDSSSVRCQDCGRTYDPQAGPARGTKAHCPHCKHEFAIAHTVRATGQPPSHRLYAKLVLLPGGAKAYMRATERDLALFAEAERALTERHDPYPIVPIQPGYNTNQALGYNYRYWHEMFNARQLLSLSMLGDRIVAIADPALRNLFLCLLSGVLEFNNMFASYKGEGTGAVRHMFSHHILKPERVPLEANLWGTPKSSGSFSTLFESRILRALDYAENPFELRLQERNGKRASAKVYDLSEAIGYEATNSYREFAEGKQLYLSCGDSGSTDIATRSVDAVITDPPFFDNVHYSQLADFFYVWQRHFMGKGGKKALNTTRQDNEVQNGDYLIFTERLSSVWKEAHRVLKNDGLLVFSYHHSRPEGWSSILKAIMDAGFVISAAQPIKSEMSVAMPKQQTKEPIDLDIIIVCRKRGYHSLPSQTDAMTIADHQVKRLHASGRGLSRNDIRIIVTAQWLKILSFYDNSAYAQELLQHKADEIDAAIDRLLLKEARYDSRPLAQLDRVST